MSGGVVVGATGHNSSFGFMEIKAVCASPAPILFKSARKPVTSMSQMSLMCDNVGELGLVDTRKTIRQGADGKDSIIIEDLPKKITGTYSEDYDIKRVNTIIRKKLQQDKFTRLKDLQQQRQRLQLTGQVPQKYIDKICSQEEIRQLTAEIEAIENGDNLRRYEEQVRSILNEYSQYESLVKNFMINEEQVLPQDNKARHRLYLIERFLDIASAYIEIDVVRVTHKNTDRCSGCSASLAKIAPSEEGTIRCNNCQTEHSLIILSKMAKDGARINISNSTDDESIDNFLRAFNRYQGLQTDPPPESLYEELDEYFIINDRPTGAEIRQLPLNDRGRRGDTNHKMLWTALSDIDCSEYYEHANLIGHVYWGWELPNVKEHRETIISHYNKTQKVFYQIPIEERGRNSSLGTQYRLWRHLQLVGHRCFPDEFKIAENPDSLRTHNRLWKLMCERANDPDIRYIN